jgi:hypothetical protein
MLKPVVYEPGEILLRIIPSRRLVVRVEVQPKDLRRRYNEKRKETGVSFFRASLMQTWLQLKERLDKIQGHKAVAEITYRELQSFGYKCLEAKPNDAHVYLVCPPCNMNNEPHCQPVTQDIECGLLAEQVSSNLRFVEAFRIRYTPVEVNWMNENQAIISAEQKLALKLAAAVPKQKQEQECD